MDLHESNLDRYPASVRRHLGPADDGPWRRLDLTGWSRAERGTPVYPEIRAGLGLADGLAAKFKHLDDRSFFGVNQTTSCKERFGEVVIVENVARLHGWIVSHWKLIDL